MGKSVEFRSDDSGSSEPPSPNDHEKRSGKEEVKQRSVIRRILSASFLVLVTLFVLVALAVVFSVALLPRATGAQALIVLSGSMEPSIPVGSVVIARPVDAAEVRASDVITFAHGSPAETATFDAETSPLVTHRVIGVEKTEAGPLFHTKGDANTVPDDPPVPAADLQGKVWYHIPYFGYAQQAMTQGPTTLYVVAGLLFVFGIWLLSVALGDDDEEPDEEAEPDGLLPEPPEPRPHATRDQEVPR